MTSPVVAWNDVADDYDRWYSDAQCVVENAGVARLLKRHGLLPVSGLAMPVLDIGCGTGLYADLASDVNARVVITGTDVAERMIRQAKAKHPSVRWMVGDAHVRVPGAFDGVVSLFGSLSYVPDPAGAISGVKAGWMGAPVFLMLLGERRRSHHDRIFDGRFRGVRTDFYTTHRARETFRGVLSGVETSYFSTQLLPASWPLWVHRAFFRWLDPWLSRLGLGQYVIVFGVLK